MPGRRQADLGPGDPAVRHWADDSDVGAVREYLAPLDGLRALAVGLVLMVHSAEVATRTAVGHEARWLRSAGVVWGLGGTGVHLFFVLSGFLLFLPWAGQLEGSRQGPSSMSFYRRRARRILPAYWGSLVILAFAVLPLAQDRPPTGDVVAHAFFVHNAWLSSYHSINGVFWTMAIEVQFYVVLPLVAALVVLVGRRRPSMPPILIALATVLASPLAVGGVALLVRALPQLAQHRALSDVGAFFSVFAAGMLAAMIHVRLTRAPDDVLARRAVRVWAWGGLGLLAFQLGLNLGHAELLDAYLFAVRVGLGYAGVLLGVLHLWPRAARVFSNRVLAGLGVISYSVYIWHYPIFDHLVGSVLGGHHFAALRAATGLLAAVIPLSYVSYRVFERPFFVSLRQRAAVESSAATP